MKIKVKAGYKFFSEVSRILTNPTSKSKVHVQVQTDDWVFIKIRVSNHPPTYPPDHPPDHPSGKVSKKQDRAILPK